MEKNFLIFLFGFGISYFLGGIFFAWWFRRKADKEHKKLMEDLEKLKNGLKDIV